MYQIDNATAVGVLPAPSAPGPNPNSYFTKGNPAGAVPATIVDDEFLNMMMMELCNTITGAGIGLDKTNRSQLLAAIKIIAQGGSGAPVTDTGVPNAYVATLAPVPAANPQFKFLVRIGAGNTNTGASTMNVNGLGAVAIKTMWGNALPAGMLKAGCICEFVYDATSATFILLGFVERGQLIQGASQFLYTGWVQLPGGFIIQWGTSSGGGGASFSFPMTFPTACFACYGAANQSVISPGGASIFGNGYPNSASSGNASANNVAFTVSWLAIGI